MKWNYGDREEALDRIDRAIDMLRAGWVRDKLTDWRDGHLYVCAEGACRMTASDYQGLAQPDWLFFAISHKCQEMYQTHVIRFNDVIANSVDDVIALFEKVRAEI